MALATVADLKSYLRIESAAEDALLALIMARAQSMLEMWTDTPITATSQTSVDRAESLDILVTSLVFPRRPAQVTAIDLATGARQVLARDLPIGSLETLLAGRSVKSSDMSSLARLSPLARPKNAQGAATRRRHSRACSSGVPLRAAVEADPSEFALVWSLGCCVVDIVSRSILASEHV
jgi:hypothetical protein